MGLVRYRLACCLCLAACSYHPGAAGTATGSGDGGFPPLPDGADAPAVCATWHPHHFDPCMIPAPSTGLDLAGAWTFSTDSGELTGPSSLPAPAGGPLTQTDGTMAYIISIQSLTVEPTGSLRVIGGKPLIVASWGDIAIDGSIDAGSTAGQAGAGSSPSECTATGVGTGVNAAPSGGSGGGGGGGFHGTGGTGGTGDNPACCAGGAGGGAITTPTVVIGGCTGGASGQAGAGDPGAMTAISTGGAGGGAIQLTSMTKVTVSGTVTSGGEGGGGAPTGSACGGGGGGAGGFVGFDAAMIDLDGATIAANGGGGGGSAPFAGTGAPGQDGQPSATQATGGAMSTCSEAGMLGGAGATLDGASSTNMVVSCGGAGGGGGVGYILTWGAATTAGATISPPVQAGP